MAQQVESTPAIGISYQAGISEQRQAVFQCFVPMDCTPETLNAALDKLRAAADRQAAFVRLPIARERLAAFEKVHARAIEDMARIDSEREQAAKLRHAGNATRRTDRLSAQEQAAEQKALADKANAQVTMSRHESEIAALKVEIADLEQKVS